MIVTLEWLKETYEVFNQHFWEGKLPTPVFKITNAKHTFGQALCKFTHGYKSAYDITLRMSNYYDSPEKVKCNTLLHEMIHIADFFYHPEHYKSKSYNAHGFKFFQPEAKRISKEGWTITAKVTNEEVAVSKLSALNEIKRQKKINDGYYMMLVEVLENPVYKDQIFMMKLRKLKTRPLSDIISEVFRGSALPASYKYKSKYKYTVYECNIEKYLDMGCSTQRLYYTTKNDVNIITDNGNFVCSNIVENK